MTPTDLMDMIQATPFMIYGNGYIARRLYKCIKSLDAAARPLGFVVTNAKNGETGPDGTPVTSIREAKKTDVTLFVAAHDTVADEMQKTARRYGFQNVVWIYPWLWQIELGEPIERNRLVSTKKLAAEQQFYNLAIDYLSIAHILEGREHEIYVKMQSAWSTRAVAEKRLERFKSRIADAACHGFHEQTAVKLNEKNELLDGMHSVALALFFGATAIHADIYPATRSFYDGVGIYRRGVLMKEDLPTYYSVHEIREIETVHKEIRGLSS